MSDHNRTVCWLRAWSAIGSTYAATFYRNRYAAFEDLAMFERRRYEMACYAFGTTSPIFDEWNDG